MSFFTKPQQILKSLTVNLLTLTARKLSKYRVFSGPYFPIFDLNTKIYSVFNRSMGKIRTRKTLYLDNFHAVVLRKPSATVNFTRKVVKFM